MIQATVFTNQLVYEAPLFSVLHIEGLALFVPQLEVDMLEPASGLKLEYENRGCLGVHRIDELEYEIFYLNRNLQPAVPNKASNNCVLLRNERYQFGLLCDHLSTSSREQVQLRSVPGPMLPPYSPITAIAINDGQLGCVTTVSALYQHLQMTRLIPEKLH